MLMISFTVASFASSFAFSIVQASKCVLQISGNFSTITWSSLLIIPTMLSAIFFCFSFFVFFFGFLFCFLNHLVESAVSGHDNPDHALGHPRLPGQHRCRQDLLHSHLPIRDICPLFTSA
jgi:hypothetical protein